MKKWAGLLIFCLAFILVFACAQEAKAIATTKGIVVGIEEPVPGEHPNFSPELTVITDYGGDTGTTTNSVWIDKSSSSPITGGIQWYDEDLNQTLSSSDVFVLGHTYRLAMAIKFTFQTTRYMSSFSSQLAFPSSGGFHCIAYDNNGYGYYNGVYFYYTFEPATLPVPALTLTITVDPPVPGSSPSLSVNYPSNTHYTNGPVSWYDLTYNRAMSATDTFEYGHDYRLSFGLIPEEWYYFTADNAASSATINGVAVDEFSFINKSEIQVNHVFAAPRLVTFSAWGGTGEMAPVAVTKGDMYTLPPCTFTAPALYEFDKWDLGAPGTQVKITENTEIKAQWKVITTPPADTTVNEVTVSGGVYQLNHSKQTATLVKAAKKNATKLTIKDTVSANGKKYKVTAIKAGACKGMGKLKTLTIGKNIKDIGKGAFQNCKKLKTITIKTKSLTAKTVKSNAFKGIYKKATFKCPKGKAEAYKRILMKKGAPKTCTFK